MPFIIVIITVFVIVAVIVSAQASRAKKEKEEQARRAAAQRRSQQASRTQSAATVSSPAPAKPSVTPASTTRPGERAVSVTPTQPRAASAPVQATRPGERTVSVADAIKTARAPQAPAASQLRPSVQTDRVVAPRVELSVGSRMTVQAVGHHDRDRCTVEHRDKDTYRVETEIPVTNSIGGKSEEGCPSHASVRLVKLHDVEPVMPKIERRELLSALVLGDALNELPSRRGGGMRGGVRRRCR